ncbi:hypothetical protein NDU88_009213 [Pleurodeles waltl]|uniref:Secreted protein n=1 Tax=Pleurodeles waltl TaxID=8319 RepID=A0AAV7QUK5_PLEWA|nr:hypothetical protein NDU88_009213 [Pleurodeles waltl]
MADHSVRLCRAGDFILAFLPSGLAAGHWLGLPSTWEAEVRLCGPGALRISLAAAARGVGQCWVWSPPRCCTAGRPGIQCSRGWLRWFGPFLFPALGSQGRGRLRLGLFSALLGGLLARPDRRVGRAAGPADDLVGGLVGRAGLCCGSARIPRLAR